LGVVDGVFNLHVYCVADPVSKSGIRCFLDSWIRDPDPESAKEKKPEPGSRMNILELIFQSLASVFWVKYTKTL
jgi:hypothetical protein